mmetsp:Transcript_16591/g.37280  ORF Transcript_16591/g.37280 Transcript_16591/m.37280 type:complete len:91 (-) Transcript_16591:2308-2580(-)
MPRGGNLGSKRSLPQERPNTKKHKHLAKSRQALMSNLHRFSGTGPPRTSKHRRIRPLQVHGVEFRPPDQDLFFFKSSFEIFSNSEASVMP